MGNFCNPCSFKNIIKIVFYEILFYRCEKCDYSFINLNDYKALIYNIICHHKIGNLTYNMDEDILSKKDLKKLHEFKEFLKIDKSILINDNKNICPICRTEHLKYGFFNKKVKYFICDDCQRLFFNIDEFNNLLEDLTKKKTFYFKLKEIFTKLWSKNNAK